jgi:hypothetical protein
LREQQGLPPVTPANSSLSEEEKEESDGGRPPREVESPAPIAMSHGGGCGAGARGKRGGARHQDVSGGIRERRGGADERHGGASGHYSGAPRTLEEEEAGLLQLEVRSTSHERS